MKEIGVVKTFFPQKGFGFIAHEEGGKDIFFRVKNGKSIKVGEGGKAEVSEKKLDREPKTDDRVMFDAVAGKEGKLMASPWCFAEDWEAANKKMISSVAPSSSCVDFSTLTEDDVVYGSKPTQRQRGKGACRHGYTGKKRVRHPRPPDHDEEKKIEKDAQALRHGMKKRAVRTQRTASFFKNPCSAVANLSTLDE